MSDHSQKNGASTSGSAANGWTPEVAEENERAAADLVDGMLDTFAVTSQTARTAARTEISAALAFEIARGKQPGHRAELAAGALDLMYRRLTRVPHAILPPATPPEQPAEMPRQSLTPGRILPRLRRDRRGAPIARLTHAA